MRVSDSAFDDKTIELEDYALCNEQIIEHLGCRLFDDSAQPITQALLDLEVHQQLPGRVTKEPSRLFGAKILGKNLQIIGGWAVGRIEGLEDAALEKKE